MRHERERPARARRAAVGQFARDSGRPGCTPTMSEAERRPAAPPRWRAYVMSVAVCAAAAAIAAPLHEVVDPSNIVMVFLLGVVGAAVRYGRGPAVLAAFVSVATFDFLYVPPRYSFSVADVQVLPTFVVMLVVALVIGQLTAVLRSQLRAASS